jgi:predicted nucleotidyltransferase component of viral defense system
VGEIVKEAAIALVRDIQDPVQRLNILREYLQAFILRSLHESEAFLSLSFVGGTALRFLFELPRFSEDLDFSVEDEAGYEPSKWMAKLDREMTLGGYDVAVRLNDRKTVNVAWVRTGGILREAGLSAMASQKLSIKLEMDTRPPRGAVLEKRLARRHMLFSLRHHDLASLMAGKIHALVTRKYQKGRDWYDLAWYRAKLPPVEPNLALLQNALDQTEGAGAIRADRWQERVRARLESLDEEELQREVAPFLERPRDARILTIDNLKSVIGS